MPNSNDKNKTTNVKKWLIDWGFERNEILCLLPNMVEICNWYVNEFTFTPRVCTVYWCLYKHLLWIPPQAVIASRASEGGQCLLITCHLRECCSNHTSSLSTVTIATEGLPTQKISTTGRNSHTHIHTHARKRTHAHTHTQALLTVWQWRTHCDMRAARGKRSASIVRAKCYKRRRTWTITLLLLLPLALRHDLGFYIIL